ncbi:MAG: hypothetical protein KC457_35105, partial [Myxococcales bacterium]|nr:hypothetical protein [Myxococcales bacterium]
VSKPWGAAIYFAEGPNPHTISNTSFVGNSALYGGALFIDDDPSTPDANVVLAITGGDFTSNNGDTGAGCIYSEEVSLTIDGVLFTENTGYNGGCIWLASGSNQVVNDKLEISNSRFIANHSTHSNGGALRIQEINVTVVNSEFVDNIATTVGAGIYGRADVYASTFANNVAPSGSAIYAPAGPQMLFRHSVAYPDTIWGSDIVGAWSCSTGNNLSGAPQVKVVSPSPFAPADLDEDGYDEWYLVPGHGCSGMVNGVLDVIDWEVMTTFQS